MRRHASKRSSDPENYRPLDVPRRIYILGSGSVGKFIAHSLRGIPDPPPITLLLHRPTFYEEFKALDNSITVVTDRVSETRSGFDAELALPDRTRGPQRAGHFTPTDRSRFKAFTDTTIIDNLIVTTKAPATVSAIDAVKHRLTRSSTILFLQNGMGVIEEINREIFPNPRDRPNYMLGINSHGVNSPSDFTVNHAGHGVISIGLVPRIPFRKLEDTVSQDHDPLDPRPIIWATSSRYLLRTMTRTPLLAAVALSPTDLLQAQLEKLAVNCLINPLTVMLDSHNGVLLSNHSLKRVSHLLLAEICLVIHSLPELQGIPGIKQRFSIERLNAMTQRIASKTAQNISSMLADVRRGMKTEVEYINGYIVKRGEELGIKAVMNYMLMHLVVGKHQMISREIDDYIPFRDGSPRRVEKPEEDLPFVGGDVQDGAEQEQEQDREPISRYEREDVEQVESDFGAALSRDSNTEEGEENLEVQDEDEHEERPEDDYTMESEAGYPIYLPPQPRSSGPGTGKAKESSEGKEEVPVR